MIEMIAEVVSLGRRGLSRVSGALPAEAFLTAVASAKAVAKAGVMSGEW